MAAQAAQTTQAAQTAQTAPGAKAVVTVSKEAGGLALLALGNEPVNIMSLQLWKELGAALDALEADSEIRAIIFYSGLKKNVFTAGLDIKELYPPLTTPERFQEYWRALSTAMIKIYSSKMVTAAAIKGACPAGGCMLSLCCDYRVITADGSMGLNEVQIGLGGSPNWVDLFKQTVGHRQAELMLQKGVICGASKLLELGMVDAVVEGAEQVLPAAREEVEQWLSYPDEGRVFTKLHLRQPLADRWLAGAKEEAKMMWDVVSNEKTVATLGKTLERLSGGKKPQSKLGGT